jgi:hypothetical protein
MKIVNDERGAALVEFAIVLPLLLLLIGGIIQFGFIFNGQITLTSAVREGARHAVVGNSDIDVKDKVKNSSVALMLEIDEDDISIIDEVDENGNEAKRVNAKGTVLVFMPFMGFLKKDDKPYIELTASSIMRNEKF